MRKEERRIERYRKDRDSERKREEVVETDRKRAYLVHSV